MSDKRKNNGGHSTKGKAGRKSKAEEMGLPMLLKAAITNDDWIALFGVCKQKAKEGSSKHLELLMHYQFGKPSQTIDLNQSGSLDINVPKIIFTDERKA